MADAIGYSNYYPAVPIMNVISMILCLLLVPGFWRTRIVALVTQVVWIFLGNLMVFISMIQWRGNTNDVPILAHFIATFWRMWEAGRPASRACFAHFTWQRLQPRSMRQLYDTRRRNNLIHFVVSVIVPVLWAPLYLLSCKHRYVIIEDIGPSIGTRTDWPGFVISLGPQILCYLVVILFNTLALATYWRMKREETESDLWKHHLSVRTQKLLLLGLLDIPNAVYGIFSPVQLGLTMGVGAASSFAENIASLQTVLRATRSSIEENKGEAGFISAILIPLTGFYLFAWFGCGEEARKTYREALMKPVRLIGLVVEEHQPHVGSSASPWSYIVFPRPKLPQSLTNSLLLTRPSAPQITPYTSDVPRDNSPEPSATHAKDNPSSPVGNGIDIRRQGKAPSRGPVHRLSMHKPPPPTLNSANAISSASDIPLRPLSYHKPPFIPLVPPTDPAITGPDVSGGVAPRAVDPDSARRQEKFALRAPPRRISYHKPNFVPLVPANPGAVANGLGPTVPLVEAPRDLISDRNARLQVERALDSGVAPPAFSSPSTSTAPPFSAPFASMAPPPPFSSPSNSIALPPPFSSPSSSAAPRARPRRLSYHKPAFVPLAPPANNISRVATALEPGVPLEEAPRDLIGDRNARLQAESALDSGVAPSPFSSPSIFTAPPSFSAPFASISPPPAFSSLSTSTASPPPSDVSTPISPTSLSTPSTRTPAPPYEHVNSFLDHVV